MPKRDGGGRLGLNWAEMSVGKPVKYPGTYFGAKAQVWRANKAHFPSRYRSFRKSKRAKSVYVERIL